MLPVPILNTCSVFFNSAKNASCTALSAFAKSSLPIITDILYSDEPCAIARTLIPLRPSAANNRPDIPGVFFIFSPTMAKTERFSSIAGTISLFAWISSSNSTSIKCIARLASDGLTANVMLCSEEDWVISTTLICSLANSVKSRPLKPDLPIIPDPLRLMTEISEIEEIPLIGSAVFPLSN
ncbi:hypothetical protein D3C81_936840 [compost metagenome]